MPEKTAAQKKAQKKYMEKFMVAQVRMERTKYTDIQAAASVAGESINAYINRAIDNQMERDASGSPSEAAEGPDSILTPATLETAQRAAEFTGETVPAFLERAAEVQAERDQRSHGMADKIAGVKHPKKGGKPNE